MISKVIQYYICERKISYRHLIIIFCFIFVLFFLLSSSFNILFKNDFDIKNKVFYNIDVKVKKDIISGDLNKYITIKSINNNCYIDYCGFPSEGDYTLREINFISISDKRFLSYACVKEYGSCFYNISNDFIENFKIKLLSKINYDIKIGLLMIINLIIIGFLDTKRVRGKYNG